MSGRQLPELAVVWRNFYSSSRERHLGSILVRFPDKPVFDPPRPTTRRGGCTRTLQSISVLRAGSPIGKIVIFDSLLRPILSTKLCARQKCAPALGTQCCHVIT